MKRKLVPIAEWLEAARKLSGGAPVIDGEFELIVARDSAATADLANADGRTIPYVLSDSSVARDNHTVATGGFELEPFRSNPVFLWAHDSSEPPIGRLQSVNVQNAQLVGVVEYMERDLSEFADMIFRMVKSRFLNAVSISWKPLEWKFAQGKDRIGGIDFLRQELLEVSQVPVPALATALAKARAAGIETSPMRAWAEKVLDGGTTIVIPRAELESLRKAAGVKERISIVTPPAGEKTKRKYARGLYEVANLACTVLDLDWIQQWTEYEAEIEGDGSEIPARLKDVLNQLGVILVDMTVEEVNELLAEEGEEDATSYDVAVVEAAFESPRIRAILQLVPMIRAAKAHKSRKFVLSVDRHLTQEQSQRICSTFKNFLDSGESAIVLEKGVTLRELNSPEPASRDLTSMLSAEAESFKNWIAMRLLRSGRVLSSANEASLRQAFDLIGSVLSQVDAQDPVEPVVETDEATRAARLREAEAISIKGSEPHIDHAA